jgi:hypothetical protein
MINKQNDKIPKSLAPEFFALKQLIFSIINHFPPSLSLIYNEKKTNQIPNGQTHIKQKPKKNIRIEIINSKLSCSVALLELLSIGEYLCTKLNYSFMLI